MLEREEKGTSVGNLMARGKSPIEILNEQLEGAIVLDLTGCKVEELLYYMNKQSPVLAFTGTNSAVLLVGYTSGTVSYYDPQNGLVSQMSWESADEWFAKSGSVFSSYVW